MGLSWVAVERMMKLQEVICRALPGTLTWLQAADILCMDPRRLRRWRARYQAGGQLALYDRRFRSARASTRPTCRGRSRLGEVLFSATAKAGGFRDTVVLDRARLLRGNVIEELATGAEHDASTLVHLD